MLRSRPAARKRSNRPVRRGSTFSLPTRGQREARTRATRQACSSQLPTWPVTHTTPLPRAWASSQPGERLARARPPAARGRRPSRGATAISSAAVPRWRKHCRASSSRASSGHLREGHREAGRGPSAARPGRGGTPRSPGPARAPAPSRAAAADDGQHGPEEPVAERSLQPLGQGWCHRGKRNLLWHSASGTSTDWWAPPTTTAGSRRGTSPRRRTRATSPTRARRRSRAWRRCASSPASAWARRCCRRSCARRSRTLRALGFGGSDEEVLTRALGQDEHLLRLCSSAAAMWTANAATARRRATPATAGCTSPLANLQAMFHRVLEADTTHAVLRSIFADERRFAVHAPLPGGGHFADEGAANHVRLAVEGRPAMHLFAWGRSAWHAVTGTGPLPGAADAGGHAGAGAAAPARPRAPASSRSKPPRASTGARSTPTCWRWATTAS